MILRLRRRLEGEQGFTLIELLVVVVILGILAGIAIPSYLSFRGRANNAAAQSNVRAIVPDVESFFADQGTYVGMTLDYLKTTYDQAIDTSKYALPSADLGPTTYCIQSTSGGTSFFKNGPSAQIVSGTCP
jgi:type IV pilus assembly protein PilA